MDIKTLIEQGGPLAEMAKDFVKATSVFIGELSKSNIDLNMSQLDNVSGGEIDYDAPVLDAYKKTYKPISASEIMATNKKMQEALAGENFVEGFLAAINLILLAK